MTATKRVAVGTTAAGVAACAACCAAPIAAVAASAVFAPVAGVAGVTALAITVAQRRRGDELPERSAPMPLVTHGSRAMRKLLAVLLIVAAALFVVGVAREHSLHHSEATSTTAGSAAVHAEGGDEDAHAVEGPRPKASAETHKEKREGRVLGVDLESWPLVIAFTAVSLGLAIALMRTKNRTVVALTAVVAGVAAVFDVAEIVHQANDSQTSLVVIASAVTALHLSAVVIAAVILKAGTRPPQVEPLTHPSPALST